MVTGKRFVFVAGLALALAVPTLAQRRNAEQQEAQASGNSPQIGPMAQSKPELDAFVALQNEQNPANALTMGDKFLATYPNSQLNGYVQRYRMNGLMRTGKCQEAITAGEAGLGSRRNTQNNFRTRIRRSTRSIKTPPSTRTFWFRRSRPN